MYNDNIEFDRVIAGARFVSTEKAPPACGETPVHASRALGRDENAPVTRCNQIHQIGRCNCRERCGPDHNR